MLTASIVLHNTPREQVDAVLKSVTDSGCVETLYIIDNSPNDRWRILERRHPCVRYIHSENLGYGAGQSMYEIHKYCETNIGDTALMLDILANEGHGIKKKVMLFEKDTYHLSIG